MYRARIAVYSKNLKLRIPDYLHYIIIVKLKHCYSHLFVFPAALPVL